MSILPNFWAQRLRWKPRPSARSSPKPALPALSSSQLHQVVLTQHSLDASDRLVLLFGHFAASNLAVSGCDRVGGAGVGWDDGSVKWFFRFSDDGWC